MITTGKIKDVKLRKVSPKKIAKAGLNLGVGYMVIPFIKIKSKGRKK